MTSNEAVDEKGSIITPKQSTTRSTPIGTIRLVPFPHAPHPSPDTPSPLTPSQPPPSAPSFTPDHPTTHHDGREPYLKLGRLAIIPDFRKHGLSNVLITAALTWAKQNPTYFNPSVAEVGMQKLGATTLEEVPVWKGLVCVHAQAHEKVVGVWARWGFERDEGMGRWDEEGIGHVGMWLRVSMENENKAS